MLSGGQSNENVSLLPDNPGVRIEAVQGGGGLRQPRADWVSEPVEIDPGSEFNLSVNLGTLKKYQTRWRQTLGPNIPSRKKPRQDPHIIIGSLNVFECPTYVVAPLRGDKDAASMVFAWTDEILEGNPESHVVFVGPIFSKGANKSIENGLTSLLTKYPGHVIYVCEKQDTLPSLDGLLLNALPESSKQVAIGFIPDHENVYHRSSRDFNCLRVDTLKIPFSKSSEEDKDCSIYYMDFEIPSRTDVREKDFDTKTLAGNISFKTTPGWVTRVSFVSQATVKQEGGDKPIMLPDTPTGPDEVEVTLGSKSFKIRKSAKEAWEKGEFKPGELALLQSEGLQYSNPVYSKFFEGLVSNKCNTEADTQLNPDCGIFRYIMADRYYRQVKAMKEGKKLMKVGTKDESSEVEPSGPGPSPPGTGTGTDSATGPGPGTGPSPPGTGTGSDPRTGPSPPGTGTGSDPRTGPSPPGTGTGPDPGAGPSPPGTGTGSDPGAGPSPPGPTPTGTTSPLPGSGSSEPPGSGSSGTPVTPPTAPTPVTPTKPVTGKILDRITDPNIAAYIERVVAEAEKARGKKWFGKDLDKVLKDTLALRNAELDKANETYTKTDATVRHCENALLNSADKFFISYDRFFQVSIRVQGFLESQIKKVSDKEGENTAAGRGNNLLKYKIMKRIIQRDLNIGANSVDIPDEDDKMRRLVTPVISTAKGIMSILRLAVYGPIALAHDTLKFSTATFFLAGSTGFRGFAYALSHPSTILKGIAAIAAAPVVIPVVAAAYAGDKFGKALFQVGMKLTEIERLVNQGDSWNTLVDSAIGLEVVNAYQEVTSVYNLLNIIKGSLSKTEDTAAGSPISTLKSDIDAAIVRAREIKTKLGNYSRGVSAGMTAMIEKGQDYFSMMFNSFAESFGINKYEEIKTFKELRNEMISYLNALIKEKITYMKCFIQNMNLRAIQVYKVAELEVKFKKAELEYNRDVKEIITAAKIKSGKADDFSGIDADSNASIGRIRDKAPLITGSIEKDASTAVDAEISNIVNELSEVEIKLGKIREIKFTMQTGTDTIDEQDRTSFANKRVKNVLCKAFDNVKAKLKPKSIYLTDITDETRGDYLGYMGRINNKSIFINDALDNCEIVSASSEEPEETGAPGGPGGPGAPGGPGGPGAPGGPPDPPNALIPKTREECNKFMDKYIKKYTINRIPSTHKLAVRHDIYHGTRDLIFGYNDKIWKIRELETRLGELSTVINLRREIFCNRKVDLFIKSSEDLIKQLNIVHGSFTAFNTSYTGRSPPLTLGILDKIDKIVRMTRDMDINLATAILTKEDSAPEEILIKALIVDINKFITVLNEMSDAFNEAENFTDNGAHDDTIINTLMQRIDAIIRNTLLKGGGMKQDRTRSKRTRKNRTIKLRFIY